MKTSLNTSNPAVKRILSEVKKMATDASDQFEAHPVDDDLFDWHFVLRGPADTPFEGGVYHGRIILPPQYPYKPPEFMFLCPQGRFEVGKKICLTISQHHPEQWQPSWDIRTALTAIQSFMPSPGNGAIAALDYNDTERRALASKSKEATRATLTAHGMIEAFADFLDAEPPASGGGAAAAGGARREESGGAGGAGTGEGGGGAAPVEISSPAPQPTTPGTSAADAPLFSPKPKDEEPKPEAGGSATPPPPPSSEPARAPSATPATPQPTPPRPAAPSPAPSPSGTSTDQPLPPSSATPAPAEAAAASASSAAAATAATAAAASGGGGAAAAEPQRPAYAPSTYAPARAPAAQAQRNRERPEGGEGRTGSGAGGRAVRREASGRSIAAPPPPSEDEVLLGQVALVLVMGIVLLAGRRVAVEMFPEVEWVELFRSVLQELVLLVQELVFGLDAPQPAREL